MAPQMKRACLFALLPALASFLFGSAFGQSPSGPSTSPEAPQLEQHRHIPVFNNAGEFALATDFQYYVPQSGFDRQNRDIDVQVGSIAAAAHLRQGWEFQFEGLALRAQGHRTQPANNPYPLIASSAAGVGFGPVARWNFLQFSRVRTFIQAQGDFLLFDRPWPALGTINDFFIRAGGGVGVRVSNSYWVESLFRFAHISNGECFCTGNPTWQGNSLSIGLRRSFNHEWQSSGSSHFWPFRNADENTWTTSVEDYTPLLSLSPQGGDMRQIGISRDWHFPNHLEFQLSGMTQTTRATVGLGPLVRWNFLEREHWRLFADAGADILQSGSPGFIVPWKDIGYNAFLRGRVGANFRLQETYWLEAGFGYAHVTRGFGWGGQLPSWSGQGPLLGLRHTFGPSR